MLQWNTVESLVALIGAPAVISGVMLWWFSRRMARMDSRRDAGRRETVLILRGLLTIGGLAGATAGAIREGHTNGSVTEALEDYAKYREELGAFLVEQTAKK